jgi:hypothetical protein
MAATLMTDLQQSTRDWHASVATAYVRTAGGVAVMRNSTAGRGG